MAEQTVRVNVEADLSNFNAQTDAALAKANAAQQAINQQQMNTQIKWMLIAQVGSQILHRLKETTGVMLAVKGIETINFAMSIQKLYLDAAAAFANPLTYPQGVLYTVLAGTMIGLKIESELQTYRLHQEQQKLDRVKSYMEMYG